MRSRHGLASIGAKPNGKSMSLERSQVTPDTEVELVSLCYKDTPLTTGAPGQLLQPGIYLAKELPNGAFAVGLVREVSKPEPEEKPKAIAKPKAEHKPSAGDDE